MDNASLVNWLIEHGGPVVRYRTARELADDPSRYDLPRLQQELLASPQVQRWLSNLQPGGIHHSADTLFESAMGKLLELGLRAGMAPFDARVQPFRDWFAGVAERRQGMLLLLEKIIVAAGLLRAGYDDAAIHSFALQRLAQLAAFARSGTYNLYLPPEECAHIPAAFHRYPHVRPEYCSGSESQLPYIHDLYLLAAIPAAWRTAAVQAQIESVLRYVLAPEYQALPGAYGYLCDMTSGKPRYYVIGWAVDLPGYHAYPPTGQGAAYFVQRLALMAHFSTAREHPWLQEGVRHIAQFSTPRGTYHFPTPYIKEQPNRYWVTGGHMGLEDNRRAALTREIESTFYMAKLYRLMHGRRHA